MDIKKKKAVLNQRQEKLLSGVFLKEQEIRNLIRLGLGFMLKEIKTQRQMGLDPFTKKQHEEL
jgi:hypothetical protein